MASPDQVLHLVDHLSNFERVPNELGVIILKQIPLFMQIKVGQVSTKCNTFRQMTTALHTTLYICLTSDNVDQSYERVELPTRSFLEGTDHLYGNNERHDAALRSQLYNLGLIINVDRLDVTRLEAILNQIGDMFPSLNEITFLSSRITALELRFINQALIEWNAGLQVLKLYMGNVNDLEMDLPAKKHQWVVLLDRLQTLTKLHSLTINCTERVLEIYQRAKTQPNEPLFPILAQLREFYLSTNDYRDLIYSSFESLAVDNLLERAGVEFINSPYSGELITKYANLGQHITSRFTHLNEEPLRPGQLHLAARLFTSITVLELTWITQQHNYKSTMAHLSQLANLVELSIHVYKDFGIANKQSEADTLVTPIPSVRKLYLYINWQKHGIVKKLCIHQMFPNVERLDVCNSASYCWSKKCAQVEDHFGHNENAFHNCISYFLDPLKPVIRRLGVEHFRCDYMHYRDTVPGFIRTYCESIKE